MDNDPNWSQPLSDYQQQGSFKVPFPPPPDAPNAGDLVALPCINTGWLKLLLGAADQLRNPSTWDTAGDVSALNAVLEQADLLRSMLAEQVGCVNPVINVQLDCTNGLQYQTADMVWHVGTPMSTICGCTTACIIPTVPPNPQGALIQQHACNIAGFLAQEIIKLTMNKMVSYVGTSDEQITFAKDVLSSFAFAFPITYAFSNAAYDFYNLVKGELLSQVTTAAGDPALWSEVTCAIYSNIRVVGYVDSTNFASVQAALHAMSYTYSWVPNAIGNYWGDLGLTIMQELQNFGAMDDVDCSDCAATWCWYMDFTVGPSGWVDAPPGGRGHWVSGQGWVADSIGGGDGAISIQQQMPVAHPHITQVDCLVFTGAGSAIQLLAFLCNDSACDTEQSLTMSGPTGPNPGWISATGFTADLNWVQVNIANNGYSAGNPWKLLAMQLHGTGVNPFGPDNCIH